MKSHKKQGLLLLLVFVLAIVTGYGSVKGIWFALSRHNESNKRFYALQAGNKARADIDAVLNEDHIKRLMGEKAVLKEPLQFIYENDQTIFADCAYALSEDSALRYGFSQPFLLEVRFTLNQKGAILDTEIRGIGKQPINPEEKSPAMADITLSQDTMEEILKSYEPAWWEKNGNSLTGEERYFQAYIEKIPDKKGKTAGSYELAVFPAENPGKSSQKFVVKADPAWENETILWEEGDYNFDGYTDGRIGISRGPYLYFLWNRDKGLLKEDTSGLKNIKNPMFLKDQKVIIGAEERMEGIWSYAMYSYYGQRLGRVKEMELEEHTGYTSRLLSQLSDFFENDLGQSIGKYLDREELKDVVGEDAKEKASFGYVKPFYGSPFYTAVFTLSQRQKSYLGIPVEQVIVEIPIRKDFSRIDKPDFYALSTDSQARRRYSKEDLIAAERHRREGLKPLSENEMEIYVSLGGETEELRVYFQMLSPVKENLGAYQYEMKVYKAGSPAELLQSIRFKSNMGIRNISPVYDNYKDHGEQYFNPVFEDFDNDGIKDLRITRLISADEIYDYYKWNQRKEKFYFDHTETVTEKEQEE